MYNEMLIVCKKFKCATENKLQETVLIINNRE